MPDQTEIRRKLQESELLGRDPLIDRFLGSFVGRVAGKEIYGVGLQMAYELACSDVKQEYPLPVQITFGITLDSMFDRIIDTVTPDPQVAQEAKNARKIVEERLRRLDSNP